MQDAAAPFRSFGQRVGVPDIAGEKLDGRQNIGETLSRAPQIVVSDADVVTILYQAPDQSGANETGAAGDEILSLFQSNCSFKPVRCREPARPRPRAWRPRHRHACSRGRKQYPAGAWWWRERRHPFAGK